MKVFECTSCGAPLEFQPQVTELQCPYCDSVQSVATDDSEVKELDFEDYLDKLQSTQEAAEEEHELINCQGCGAEVEFYDNQTAGHCSYCDTPLVKTWTTRKRLIKAQAILPFSVTDERAQNLYRKWLKSLWFAPSDLHKRSISKQLKGMYVPYWTYDSDTDTEYRGERGDAYYVNETHTRSVMKDGKWETETYTKRVRKIRWSPASGHVSRFFNDVLIIASHSLPRNYADALEPWDLQHLENFQEQFLAGFIAERYQVDLKQGFAKAKRKMEPAIERHIRSDIGGDEQRIHAKSTHYSRITFKHILLPIWLSSYKYKGQVYQFLINGRTGEVQGSRPYSFWKIFFACSALVIVIFTIIALLSQT